MLVCKLSHEDQLILCINDFLYNKLLKYTIHSKYFIGGVSRVCMAESGTHHTDLNNTTSRTQC